MDYLRVLPISDIHLETHSHSLSILKEDVDVVCLCGDIGNKFQAIPFIESILNKGIIVLYVLGNHEYYNINSKVRTIDEIKNGWKKRAERYDNFYFLDNNSVIIEGVKFIGSTFWSKIDYTSKSLSDKFELEQSDLKNIFQSKKVNAGGRILSKKSLTIEHYNQLHDQSLAFVKKEAETPFEGVKVLMTHYPLTSKSIPQKNVVEKDSMLNDNELKFLSQFYQNNYDEMLYFSDIKYALHGHIHESIFYEKNGTTNICNPLGYKKYNETNEKYDEKLILKIERKKINK